jgi:hypothetical protein
MTDLIDSMRGEYLRYKALAEAAITQLTDAELCDAGPWKQNSIAVIVWHLSGNLQSRFTDFLTSDLEKPWRCREEEFEPRVVSRSELLTKWQRGWDVLSATLATLADGDLGRPVTVRGQALKAHEVLHRLLAHTAYHVGQIVFVAKAVRGSQWQYLSIPPGQSEAYNRNPTGERAASHARTLRDRVVGTERS